MDDGSQTALVMVSSMPSTKPAIRLPETVEECEALRRWAITTPRDVPAVAGLAEMTEVLRALAVAMPKAATADADGKLRVAVYLDALSGYSLPAWDHMRRRALATLQWFPTIAQCVELLREWRAPVADQDTALRLCGQFQQARMESWLDDLRAGGEIGDAPDRWKRIAYEQGLLRREGDGYARRPMLLANAGEDASIPGGEGSPDKETFLSGT